MRFSLLSLILVLATGCAASRDATRAELAATPRLTQGLQPPDLRRTAVANGPIQLVSAQTEPYLQVPRVRDGEVEPVAPQLNTDSDQDTEPSDIDLPGNGTDDGGGDDDETESGDGSAKQTDSEELPAHADGPLPTLDDPPVTLDTVIESVHAFFPLVQAAYLDANIAQGNAVAAQGEFDTKVKLKSENGPVGFYQTYRQTGEVVRPVFDGGEVFGRYKLGRGDFQPWYEERESNEGGEFRLGGKMPLLRDRLIDSRRANLWRAEYDTQIAQPEIRTQLVGYTLDASLAYWKWVAETRKYAAERDWLDLAATRNKQISRRVDVGDLDPPELVDNERAIAKRKAKLADQLRKVQQAAVKLSFYYRDNTGRPIALDETAVAKFPQPEAIDDARVEADIAAAMIQRPDLQAVQLKRRRLQVDYDEANNLRMPKLDATMSISQDVGQPASSSRDKSRFEVDVGLFFEMPVQQRKALGKLQAIEAKIAQLAAKEQVTVEKIIGGIQRATVGMKQAYTQLKQAGKANELANKMADIERRKFEVGESDLLKVALREQYALEAIEGEVAALLNYFAARSTYYAELAYIRPPSPTS